MEELKIMTSAIVVQNKELETRMNLIAEAIKEGNNAVLNIGKQLKEIKDGELWKEDYKDIVECAAQFNIKKAQTYNLINAYTVYEKYNLEDFTATHCIQIARLEAKKGEKVVKKALEDNKITADMSVSKLKDYIDKRLGLDKKALTTRNQEAVKEAETEAEATPSAEAEAEATPSAVGVNKKQFVCFMLNDGKWDITSNFEGVTDEQMKALKVALKTMAK